MIVGWNITGTLSIHSGGVANALTYNAGGDGFAPNLQRHFTDLFLELIRSLAQRDVEWSV